MAFKDNNIASGLKRSDKFQVGRANEDSKTPIVEGKVLLPWPSDKATSWVYYECAVGSMLDSGIVVHNRLPQVDRAPDTLASCDLDDPNLDKISGFGVNLRCNDQYQDIVQRMGHARYWFRLWGQAIRIGYPVPIPGIETIGGVPAIPYDQNPQWAYNRIAPGGNYGGVVLWHAQWSLWYTTLVPPRKSTIPAVDLASGVTGASKSPAGMQVPFSQPDDNAWSAAPPIKTDGKKAAGISDTMMTDKPAKPAQ